MTKSKLQNINSASFDESLHKITQKEQMNIYIIYWNSEQKRVEVRYYETNFTGQATAKDLQHFLNDKSEMI